LAQVRGCAERVWGVQDRLAGGGRLAQLRGRRFRPVGVIGNGRLAQLGVWANGVWGIDREPAGGGRLAQLRGCTKWVWGVKGKLAGGGSLAHLRVGQRMCHST
jgi:hypothetical protein